MLATALAETPYFIAHRTGRHFMISLREEHHVLSTSEWNGGMSNTIRYMVNHQSMESNADYHQADKVLSPVSYTHLTLPTKA